MKTPPDRDPLLRAVLGDSRRDASLAFLLTAARRRRQRRGVRRLSARVGIPLLCMAIAGGIYRTGWKTTPVSPVPMGLRITKTSEWEGPLLVGNRSDGVERVENLAQPVESVSTSARLEDVEVIRGEDALMASLPGGVGFIGDGSDRHFVWFGADRAESERTP